MRVVVAIAAVPPTGPAFAQSEAPVPKYGEEDKAKTPSEIEAEKAADRAYHRALGNVPNAAAPADPWGGVRSDNPPKPAASKPVLPKKSAAKPPAAKQSPTDHTRPATPAN